MAMKESLITLTSAGFFQVHCGQRSRLSEGGLDREGVSLTFSQLARLTWPLKTNLSTNLGYGTFSGAEVKKKRKIAL